MQAVDVLGAKVPAKHVKQLAEPALLKEPAVQLEHIEALAPLNCPALQLVQGIVGSLEKVPAEQKMQADALVAL